MRALKILTLGLLISGTSAMAARAPYYDMTCEVAEGSFVGYRYKKKGGWIEKSVDIRWHKNQLNFYVTLENAAGKKKTDETSGQGSYGITELTDTKVVAQSFDLYDAVPYLSVEVALEQKRGKWFGSLYYDSVSFDITNCTLPQEGKYSEDE